MNGNLFKIVLVSVVAILLAIIGGIMSADGDPLSIVLAVSPFILAALFLMKGKVWYLWILIPILFLPIPSLRDYAPLLAYGITLPCYLWNAMLRRSSLTWNSAPLLDAVVLVLFMHVGYIFLEPPFRSGAGCAGRLLRRQGIHPFPPGPPGLSLPVLVKNDQP